MIQILVLVNDLQNHWAIRPRLSRRNWKSPVFSLLEMLVLGKFPGLPNALSKKHPGLIKVLLIMVTLLKHGRTFCGATALIIEKYGLQHICDIDRGGSPEDVETVQEFFGGVLVSSSFVKWRTRMSRFKKNWELVSGSDFCLYPNGLRACTERARHFR